MKKKLLNFPMNRFLTFGAVLVFLSVTVWVGCEKEPFNPQDDLTLSQDLVELSADLPEVQSVMAIQDQHTEELMSISGVVGTATSATPDGKPAVLVLVVDETIEASLPKRLDGAPVEMLVTGKLKALKGPPGGGGGFDPTAKHRPAPNGVSLGHPDITAGTLGCIVSKGGATYILSNNHVMANENQASIGDAIYQPGPYDGGTAADQIATLDDYVEIVFSTSANNRVDAAIAVVNPADVTNATVSYGAPNTTTTPAAINLTVEKYGRTTENTDGYVSAINATVNVGYDSGTARFVDQVVIERKGPSFSQGGDSGSLIVVQGGEDAGNPVGLLFAGSRTVTIANPIDAVLSELGVTIAGAGN